MREFESSLQISLNNLQAFGKLYFTPKQLYYEFCRNERSPIGLETKTAATLFGLSTIPTAFLRKNKLSLLTASAFLFGSLAISRKIPHTLSPPISWNLFEKKLLEYLRNNEIDGLLKIEKEIKFSDNFPEDLLLYGLPRILICESDEIAQMLRANQFHLQTPCGILSLREASPLKKSFQTMLSNAEEPQIFFLHDASPQAFSLIPELRNILESDPEIPLRPLGLRPVHARRLHLFTAKNLLPDFKFSEFDYLDESEINWFKNGFTAEVSAVSPVRLLRVLRRLILGLEVAPSEWQISLPQKSLGFM